MTGINPLQAKEWGEFREKTGVKVVYENNLIITIHPIPHTAYNIGYLPRTSMPTKEMVSQLKEIGQREKCIFIQLEPYVETTKELADKMISLGLVPSAHPLFSKYTFILDLTKSEEELLKNMHPKTRYNIRIAEKHGVKILEDESDKAFEKYWKLTEETAQRQKFYAHNKDYHRLMWETLKSKDKTGNPDRLTAHLLTAVYQSKILVTWIVFVFKDTLYYPYGASSSENREVMASNLMMWEAIKFGKRLGLKKFDMWGSMSQNPDVKDPWYGFHRFKQGYGGRLTEFLGSYDLIIDKKLYALYKIANKVRWAILGLK